MKTGKREFGGKNKKHFVQYYMNGLKNENGAHITIIMNLKSDKQPG